MVKECEHCNEEIRELKNCVEIKIGAIGTSPSLFHVHRDCCGEIEIEGIL